MNLYPRSSSAILPRMAAIDIKGQKFGRLTAIREVGRSPDRKALWLFRCDCGGEKITSGKYARTGKAQSCGCLHRERTSQANSRHRECETRLYRIWAAMKARCQRPAHKAWEYYGGRGITVCGEWQSYEPFRDWSIANGYAAELSIDRKDTNGNYEPDNCRWATVLEQNNNRRPRRWAKKPA